MKIRKAVFPVAGLGTRVLPATKAMPKEMLTIVDKPLIQYVVDEAKEAGIEHFIFVTGRNKGVIEDHFDRMFELDATLAARGKKAEMAQTAVAERATGYVVGGISPVAQRKTLPVVIDVSALGHQVRQVAADVLLGNALSIGFQACARVSNRRSQRVLDVGAEGWRSPRFVPCVA